MESNVLTQTPRGLREIIEVFGSIDSPTFEARNIVPFTLPYPLIYDGKPVARTRCHRLLVENFIAAFQAIKDQDLIKYCQNYGGIYAKRSIRGMPSHPSCHSWGIAIDMEPMTYPLGSHNRFPPAVIECFENAGFYYGGNFKNRPDGMHFQFALNYVVAVAFIALLLISMTGTVQVC